MRRSQSHHAALFALTCLAPIHLQSEAAARQDDGPVIIGERAELDWFNLEDFKLVFDGQARFERDRIEPREGQSSKDEEDLFRESLEFSSNAFIGHPNLIDLDLLGRFGLSQEDVRSDTIGVDDRTAETLLEYDINALMLRESNLPFSFYSRRTDTIIDRDFGDSVDSLVTETGGRLLFRSPKVPSSLHLFHREEDQTSRLALSEFDLIQDTLEWQSQVLLSPNQQLIWDYTFDDVEQTANQNQTTKFQRHNALATHHLDFGAEDEHNLRSTLNWFKESGDFALDRIRWNEALRLRHTRRFETRYDTVLDWQQRPDADQLFLQGSAGLRHRLFESLVTNFDVGANSLDISPGSFTSTQVFSNVNFDYTKRVPNGRLSAGLSVHVNHQEDSERGETLQITNETHVFPASGIITINRRNIIASSIIITDAAGIIVFSEGFDYTVQAFPDRVEIRRVLGGAILDGQIVLIDYQVAPEPANTTDTLGTGVTIRYDIQDGWLNGFGLYTRYFVQDQQRSSDDPLLLPADDIQELTYGVDYRIWQLFFAAEEKIHDSTISPYEADRFEARYTQPLGLGDSIVLSANYDQIDRTDEDLQSTITYLTARWDTQMTDRLHMSLGILWRDEDEDSPGGGIDVQGFEQELELVWRHRQTTIFGSVRNVMQDSSVSDSEFQTFHLGLRREF